MKTTTEVYDLVTKDIKRINLLRGGSRSSKTYSLIQIAVKWLLEGTVGGKVLSLESLNPRLFLIDYWRARAALEGREPDRERKPA